MTELRAAMARLQPRRGGPEVEGAQVLLQPAPRWPSSPQSSDHRRSLSPLLVRSSSGSPPAASHIRGSMNNYVKVSVEEAEYHARAMKKKVGENITTWGDTAKVALAGDIAEVHFLGQELRIDDKDATIVLVFPRGKPYGILEMDKMVHHPYQQAQKIFFRNSPHFSADEELKIMREGFETLEHDRPVPMSEYQRVVRRKLLQVMRTHGLKVCTFPSVDGDEIFAKISMDVDGEVIKHLAQRFSYSKGFTDEAYKDLKQHGVYQGGRPMQRRGKAVPAYAPYQLEIGHLMRPFTALDEIRIVETLLHSMFSLDELQNQSVISKYFAAARHADVVTLHEQWLEQSFTKRCLGPGCVALVAKILEIPKYGTKAGLVRQFFGEEIAFFFRWLAFYTQMLGYLGVAGVIATILEGIEPDYHRALKVGFTTTMVIWATCFNQLFRNRMAQAQQEWGMKDFELTALSFDRFDYRPDLEGTWWQLSLRGCSLLLCLAFCTSFIWLISWIEEKKLVEFEEEGENGTFFMDYGSLIVVSSIKVVSIAWGYVAPMLNSMQNHRTQARWDDGLTALLVWVKIFVTLWNFAYLAFVKTWTSPRCATTYAGVAELVWGTTAFEQLRLNETLKHQAVAVLKLPVFSYMHKNGKVCVRGCFPNTPDDLFPNAETNCQLQLRQELIMFFFVHVAYTLGFLIFPLVKVKIDMLMELRRAQRLQEDNKIERSQYSWLQFQAKCPSYTYLSWGGSRVEDFLECAIGYALLTCFGIMYPMLAFFGFLGSLVEYRLLAYRMTHVTCRPMPHGASGIGTWQWVFETISSIAILVNVMLIAFVMYPMRSFALEEQLLLCIILEHVLLGIRYLIDIAIPDTPLDVRRIDDFNAHFRRTMVKYPQLVIPPAEQYEREYAKADIGLIPGESLSPRLADRLADSEGQHSTLSSVESDSGPDGSPWCACTERTPLSFSPL
mmetsp:Transcript_125034/g.361640  ORF Transcript_125034/g.361640 Transcript_125034/m.361640 type:complete len:952 (-) Transcript_125034:83-2938(-)